MYPQEREREREAQVCLLTQNRKRSSTTPAPIASKYGKCEHFSCTTLQLELVCVMVLLRQYGSISTFAVMVFTPTISNTLPCTQDNGHIFGHACCASNIVISNVEENMMKRSRLPGLQLYPRAIDCTISNTNRKLLSMDSP